MMIYLFPDYDTLQLAITSAVAPPAVSLSPVLAGVDEANRPWLQPMAKLPRSLPDSLRKLGVKTLPAQPSAGAELVNWLQALPLRKQSEPLRIDNQTPVVFELSDAGQLPVIVQEMLRLSNDRQSFRWLQEGATSGTVLLRVIGPPYYTLLRAIDKEASGSPSSVRAYVEGPKGVWVQIGYTHALAEKIQVGDGQVLLIRAPRDWVFLPDEPFRDIYEILKFQLPNSRLNWEAAELKERLTVPLRLIAGDARDAELWVLNHNAIDQLDVLVRDAKESLVQRLIFGVGQRAGETIIVLRARPSKQPPPQLVLEAQAYSPYLKLPNLFLPVGTRLHPALRRDAVRKLLAEDTALINWLAPCCEPAGAFAPVYLRDDAFRPLSEWVEYVLDHDRQPLSEWIQQFRFDFDPFICKEETTAEKPKPPPGARRQVVATMNDSKSPGEVSTAKSATPKPKNAGLVPAPEEFMPIDMPAPSQLQIEVQALQQQFLDLEGDLDAAARLELWPELAWRQAELKNQSDAAICWINRIWEAREGEQTLLRELVGKWARMEKVAAEPKRIGEALDRLLFKESPSAAEVRALVAGILYGALQNPIPQALLDRLPRLQQFLERHENSINVRAVWLGWYHLCNMAGNDALGLARARDRLLDRLIHHGLSAEHDLPHFLRAAGHHDSERLRVVRTQADNLHDMALEWYRVCDASSYGSVHYVDLIFSFGFARLGETARSRELLKLAEQSVAHRKSRLAEDARVALTAVSQTKSDEERRNHEQAAILCEDIQIADEFLLRSYRYRIEQALRGQPHRGPLPQEIRDDLERRMPKDKLNTGRYAVDRMRERSDILEPQEELEPYRNYFTENINPELDRELAKLHDVRRPKDLVQAVQELWKGASRESTQDVDRLSILAESVMLSPRVGESFALELLAKVEPTLDRLLLEAANPKILDRQALLLERALFIAGNYDRADTVQRLMTQFILLLQRVQQTKVRTWYVNRAFGQCLQSLRKLGLRDDIGKLIEQATAIILRGKTLEELKAQCELERRGGKMLSTWPNTVEGLLYLAGGWVYFGWHDRAMSILDAARLLLHGHEDANRSDSMSVPDYVNLATAYVEVLGQAPAEFALRRIEELLLKMRRFREGFSTTRNFLARFHLAVIEAVVMSVMSEDFAIGPGARRWLEDDEYLVRRRIHRDHKVMKGLAEA